MSLFSGNPYLYEVGEEHLPHCLHETKDLRACQRLHQNCSVSCSIPPIQCTPESLLKPSKWHGCLGLSHGLPTCFLSQAPSR